MDVSEIVDRDSFRRWLEALPQGTEAEREQARRWAVLLAHRAAMRVLPGFWDWRLSKPPKKGDLTVFAIVHLGVIGGASGRYPSPRLKTAATVARAFVAAAADAAATVTAPFEASSADVTAAFVFACAATDADAAAAFASAAAGYAASAADDFAHSSAAWLALRSDCAALLSGDDPYLLPLWPADNPLAVQWSSIRTDPTTQSPGWRFWIDWYDRALTGQPQDWLLLEKIALIDPKDWDKGADHVNALIAEIRLKHLAETRPLGEDAINKGPDGRWRRAARSDIDRDILQDACDRVKDTVKRIRKAMERGNNAFNALSDDLVHLESALRRYKDRPLRLHDEFLRVQRHIARDLKSGELPDDHLVDDLNTDLGTAALDMRNACPKTAKVVADRASARFAELDERERVAVVQIAEAAATLSDEELAGEFREDAVEAVAPEGDPQDKAPVRYRLSTRLAVIATRDGKNIVDALILVGDLGGGLATFGAVIYFILSMIL